jgi:L-ascorbate metabolism protein UlaG (beta-lactamase superfamily)
LLLLAAFFCSFHLVYSLSQLTGFVSSTLNHSVVDYKKLKNTKFSRRWFIKAGSLGLAGVWSSCSDQMPARAMRGFLAESCRPVLKPQYIPQPLSWSPEEITSAWLGHSSVLVNFFGFNVLTDPVLFRRIGADTHFGTVGPKRLVAPALTPSQLPPIDLVLISHAHMDHLDLGTLRSLPGNPVAVTAHSTEDLLVGTSIRQATGLRWGEQKRVATRNGEAIVRAFEVKHWGARWRHDTYRGYNGYVVEREGKKIIFGGDTASIDSFRPLRSSGSYELAIMPIGAYRPWVCSHCTPEQAARMTNDSGAKYLLPVHFKTFAFGREGTVEPMHRLEAAFDRERIGWREVGQTFVCPA